MIPLVMLVLLNSSRKPYVMHCLEAFSEPSQTFKIKPFTELLSRKDYILDICWGLKKSYLLFITLLQ